MVVKEIIKYGISILKNPEKEFEILHNKSLEQIVSDYLKMLLLLAIVAGVFNFLFNMARSFYLRIFLQADIDYSRLLNYQIGQSFTMAFFYIIVGTFLMFFLSFVLIIFFKRIKYTEFLKIILTSSYPLLLFSWVPKIYVALIIWCIFLLSIGIQHHSHFTRVDKDSIHQRD